ncbi:MAG: alcohol dehydrogenase catalytic domain-containing protein, partial [Paracoccaceae bacterium]|nr:alcohol dehydrogenase catalytic domain-containing protein [Paracoccaceae bacterium]
MRAYQVTELGKSPAIAEVPTPEPGPGQVQIRIAACGLNFGDLLMVEGTYQETPEPPFVPGMEVSGTITALGDGVEGLALGTRIAIFGGHGGFAEYGCYDAARCIPIPDSMSFEHAAAF